VLHVGVASAMQLYERPVASRKASSLQTGTRPGRAGYLDDIFAEIAQLVRASGS
jgi:hypothetical protein